MSQALKVHCDDMGDMVCQHGVALDVHCCHCHRGFIFDASHVCPPAHEPGADLRADLAHFDRIQAEQIAARVELLEAAQAAFVFLDSVDWTTTAAEVDAAATMDRLEAAIEEVDAEPQETKEELVLSLHRCKICGTRWLLWPDHGGVWNLLDKYSSPGACCNNVAMGDQIEHLRDIPLTVTAPPNGERR